MHSCSCCYRRIDRDPAGVLRDVTSVTPMQLTSSYCVHMMALVAVVVTVYVTGKSSSDGARKTATDVWRDCQHNGQHVSDIPWRWTRGAYVALSACSTGAQFSKLLRKFLGSSYANHRTCADRRKSYENADFQNFVRKCYEKVMKILWAQLVWLKKNLRKNYEKLLQKLRT